MEVDLANEVREKYSVMLLTEFKRFSLLEFEVESGVKVKVRVHTEILLHTCRKRKE